MIPPTLLLRDTLLVGLLLTGGALAWGPEVAAVTAAGAAAAFVNFAVLIVAARGTLLGSAGAILLPMKLLLAVGLVGALTALLPPVPALIGFAAGPLGALAGGFDGARRLSSRETP